MSAHAELYWPRDRFPEALREVILRVDPTAPASAIQGLAGRDGVRGSVEPWLRSAALPCGREGVITRALSQDLETALGEAAGYLVVEAKSSGAPPRALAVIRRGGSRCVIVRPDGTEHRTSVARVAEMVRESLADPAVQRLFEDIAGGDAIGRELLAEQAGQRELTVVRYELDAAHPIWPLLKSRGALGRALACAGISVLRSAVAVGAAWTLGEAAASGLIDLGRIAAWSVLSASNIALQYTASTLLGHLSIDFAFILKRRLLQGALMLPEEDLRSQSYGAHLARLNEADLVEQMSLTDALNVLTPVAQIILACILFGRSPNAAVALPAALVFAAGAVVLAARLVRQYRACYRARLCLTEDLVEKIVGHRTRAAQENPARRHDEEDEMLSRYTELSARHDATASVAQVYARIWILAYGLSVLALLSSGATTTAVLLSIAGAVLQYQGLDALLTAAARLGPLLCAWEGIRSLVSAGRSRERTGRVWGGPDESARDTVLSGVTFAYRAGARQVLRDATMRIRSGDRILIEGPSGGGKSTLAKLIAGELRPDGGTILVDGVDVFSTSETEWRKRVASSPQFHENHIFSNTFVFNIDPVLGDGHITPTAGQVCAELGLLQLMDKMPSGAAQMLGDTGWQLSHGERSRVFIARSLLQGASVILFDESFAALDPETLWHAIQCVQRHAKTLVVIGHL